MIKFLYKIIIIFAFLTLSKLLVNFLYDSNSKLIHVTYVHLLESNDEIILENMRFFFHFAYEPCNSKIDYTIILNTNDPSAKLNDEFISIDHDFDKNLNH